MLGNHARGPAAPGRVLDASMTLLRESMDRPLDAGYAAAARSPRPSGRRRAAVTLVLAVIGGYLLAVAVVVVSRPEPQAAGTSARLRAEIERRTAEADAQERRNAAVRAEIAEVQRSALGAGGADLADRAELLSGVTGAAPVSGPGLRIAVDDAPGARERDAGGDPRLRSAEDAGVVLDRDLQVIVNGLWEAGAEGIAINGQRLTGLSAIRSAGEAILVDYRPLVPPYVIETIGNRVGLQAGFAAGDAGPYVQSMRDNSGIPVDVSVHDRLDLPGARQVDLRAARPVSTPAAEEDRP